MSAFGVILLSGGTGTRFSSPIPKQYLLLGDKEIVLHSYDLFCDVSEVHEIVVVCHPEYRYLFKKAKTSFALPGVRRQDSVFSGFKALSERVDYVTIHDGCRPLIDKEMIARVHASALENGAATASMSIQYTVKERTAENFAKKTLDRSHLLEIQTPQSLHREILERGFRHVHTHKITVTDDVSLAEAIGQPVKLVVGSYKNIKITTPEDLLIARALA